MQYLSFVTFLLKRQNIVLIELADARLSTKFGTALECFFNIIRYPLALETVNSIYLRF